jgi:hypothetical protein
MTNSKSLSLFLVALLPVGVLACSSENLSTKGQMITCTTDPGTGVILLCAPGGGSGSGGGSNTCTDIDEDGDGEPHDMAGSDDSEQKAGTPGDEDGDGIPDSEDCDSHPGEDGDHEDGAKLPYDVKPQLGQSVRPIFDAFAEEGMQPASIVSVTLDGGSWRLAELQAGTAFTVTTDDCTHQGNRDIGRDRVIVTWSLADASVHSDHLDIRYCK